MHAIIKLITMKANRAGVHRRQRDELGMTTAELLGNAALGVAALVVIWAGLRAVGLDVVDYIRSAVTGG